MVQTDLFCSVSKASEPGLSALFVLMELTTLRRSVLDELRELWEAKLMQSGALDAPPAP
jgi:hypothetical protein